MLKLIFHFCNAVFDLFFVFYIAKSFTLFMSLHRLFNAAQKWHECILQQLQPVYFDTRHGGGYGSLILPLKKTI